MNRFAARVVVLFTLAATFPIALTGIVWLAISQWGTDVGSSEAAMARARLHELDVQRSAAVNRLCHDDLAIDTLLDERSREVPSELDYDRLFRGSMEAAGLQALWVLDSLSGQIIATGHRHGVLGNEGAELTRQARSAGDRAFLVSLGGEEHQRFVVKSCSIARGGTRLTVIAGHRLSELRNLDPEQLVITDEARRRDEVLTELTDAEGVRRAVLVWRPKLDRRGPPLLLWMGCVAVLALGLALMFGGYLNRWLQSSLDELTEAATRVGRGDFDTTVRDGPEGAFPATATAFNRMTRDLRDAREQLRQAERIAARPEIRPRLEKADIRELVAQAASLHAEQRVPITAELPDAPVIAFVDADQIAQALRNLLDNARQAAGEAHPDGGASVGLSLETKTGTLYIRVRDNGAGIATDQTQALFEPYPTGKEGGAGVGLAIAQRIVTEHGGRIDVESRPGKNVFTIVLPQRGG
jgi:HAMP domain-containing protein/anti-sigma regulatory factor (Ser/Thr protein kinase)